MNLNDLTFDERGLIPVIAQDAENGEGVRFLTRSRVFTDAEYEALKGTEPPAG